MFQTTNQIWESHIQNSMVPVSTISSVDSTWRSEDKRARMGRKNINTIGDLGDF